MGVSAVEDIGYTPKEVAKLLRMSTSTVLRMCRAGRIGYKPTGAKAGQWRISRAQLERLQKIGAANGRR